jgi:hypothetical protein
MVCAACKKTIPTKSDGCECWTACPGCGRRLPMLGRVAGQLACHDCVRAADLGEGVLRSLLGMLETR